MKTQVVIFDTGESTYYKALSRSNAVSSVTLVCSRDELLQHMNQHYKKVDLLVTDLILDAEAISVQGNRGHFQFDGLSAIEFIHRHWPSVQIAVLTRYWHENNVLAAYRAGVRWYVKRKHSAGKQFVNRALRVANHETIIPDEFDRVLTNRIRILLDPRLKTTTHTDQDMLFLMLEGRNNDEIAERFGWTTVQSLYNRVSSLLAQSGFTTREQLLAHCRSIHIELAAR